MSGDWQDENTRYLSAAIARVRAALEKRCDSIANLPTTPTSPGGDARKASLWRVRPQTDTPPAAPLLSPPNPAPQLPPADETQDPSQTPAALAMLVDRLELTPFERDVLLLCVAMELDTAIAALCARAQGDPLRPWPTFALALTLFGQPSWDALSPERPLRHWRLIEINQPSGQTLTVSPLRADEWVVNYLKGLAYLDDRLAPLVTAMVPPSGDIAPSQQAASASAVERLKLGSPSGKAPVVQLVGRDAESKRVVAGLVGAAFGLSLYRLPANMAPSASADIDSFARLWQRQSILLPVALYIDAREEAVSPAIDRLLSRLNGLVVLDTRDPWPGQQQAVTIDVAKPTPSEQRAAWAAALGEHAGDAPALLAGQFNLNTDDIVEIGRATIAGGAQDAAAVRDAAWKHALAATRPRLDNLAQRIEPAAGWDDIVLLPSDAKLLHQIADQVGNRARVYQDWGFDKKSSRGFGITALFAGVSGSGKTMAAEVIAKHLKLDLYRIDLSAVVSKYIGETEKNLRKLFDAAEDGGAILFFDEADALFGKRSEVKDSHDRYANIEINYLLQRMESYGGLAILATNMKGALDQAFLRRLRFIVNFPFPSVAERETIWRKAFPPETPSSELDFARLGRLNLTGGQIALIALNAAFVAAESGSEVTMPIVLDAARSEYKKLELPIHEPDFRWPQTTVRAV